MLKKSPTDRCPLNSKKKGQMLNIVENAMVSYNWDLVDRWMAN